MTVTVEPVAVFLFGVKPSVLKIKKIKLSLNLILCPECVIV